MKVFLTGSSGYVGNYVLRALMNEGHSVKCLAREGSDRRIRIKQAYEIFHGDILSYDSLLTV